jgi:hypothetical protein
MNFEPLGCLRVSQPQRNMRHDVEIDLKMKKVCVYKFCKWNMYVS